MDKRGDRAHILIIRLSAMGDVAMTIPVINGLLAKYPNLELTVLTKKPFALLFANMDRVSVYVAEVNKRHKGLIGLWRLYKELKTVKFDAVADLHNVLRSKVLGRYFKLGNIPFVQLDKGRAEKKALTRPTKKEFKQLKSTHQRYADVFTKLGYPIELGNVGALERQQLSSKVLEQVGQDTIKWVGVAPFAAHEGKMYPLHLMKEVIHALNNTEKYKIFLFGGGTKEIRLLESISGAFDKVVNMAGKLDFSEELALISNLDVMLSMDSGNAHLAANYGIPVVTLWGVTHPYAGFYPFNQRMGNALLADREQYPKIPTSVYGNKIPEGYESAMESITPQEVVDKLLEILSA